MILTSLDTTQTLYHAEPLLGCGLFLMDTLNGKLGIADKYSVLVGGDERIGRGKL